MGHQMQESFARLSTPAGGDTWGITPGTQLRIAP